MRHITLIAALLLSLAAGAQTIRIDRQHIILTVGGEERLIAPQGTDESYYWASLSPDGRHIVYSTAKHGTFICNLHGRQVRALGILNTPKWLDDKHVAGLYSPWAPRKGEAPATAYYAFDLRGRHPRLLTDDEKNAFLQAEKARVSEGWERTNMREAARTYDSTAVDLSGLRFYLNPGHGGYNPNDRSAWTVPVPETWTNPDGYWESEVNLRVALYLRDMLEQAGAEVLMSRTTNESGASDRTYYPGARRKQRAALLAGGDRSLSAIAEEASASRVDQFISIHCNAWNGKVNYLVVLYHGATGEPVMPASLDMATLMGRHLIKNGLTAWTHENPMAAGDETFFGPGGLGVLRPLTVPGVLVEMSFYDCPAETHRYMSDDYRRLSALRLYHYICDYYHRPLPQTACISGDVRSLTEKTDTLGHKEFIYKEGSPDEWLPINGATVVLRRADGTVVDTHKTDDWYNGIFAFFNLPAGTYLLEASLPDGRSAREELTVGPADITTTHLRL
uniref:MurNAc-LAA domain-containing protein n=1 Tax=uncultured bacterium fosmid pJB102C1 TaxID=1478050 RepID=A0A0H3U8J3_9BACT|nr:hypothetical protein [uncultured bacterium fosmid pJB102C1]